MNTREEIGGCSTSIPFVVASGTATRQGARHGGAVDRALSAEALRGVVEAFVLQEGSDYGAREVSLEQKVVQVMQQLERGEARLVFDPGSETVHIITS